DALPIWGGALRGGRLRAAGDGDQRLHLGIDEAEVVQPGGGEELLVRAEQGRGLRIDGEDVEADDVDRVDRVHERAGRGGVPGLVERLGVRGQQLAHV